VGTNSFLKVLPEMVTFLLILVAALAYVWRKKAIGWG